MLELDKSSATAAWLVHEYKSNVPLSITSRNTATRFITVKRYASHTVHA